MSFSGAVETCIHTGTAEEVIDGVKNILESIGQGDCKACICDIIPQFCQEERLDQTTGTGRENAFGIQNEIERAFEKKEKALFEAFEDQLSQLSSKFEMREAELKESLEAEMKERLETEVAAAVRKEMRDGPNFIQCAHKQYLRESDTHKFVTFDRLISDYSNNGGSLDVQTGTFLATVPGYYTVTYSAIATLLVHDGGYAKLQLWKNDHGNDDENEVDLGSEGYFEFGLGSGLEGSATYFHGQGSRTVILRMEPGDTLHLYASDIGFAIDDLVMCISLTVYDGY